MTSTRRLLNIQCQPQGLPWGNYDIKLNHDIVLEITSSSASSLDQRRKDVDGSDDFSHLSGLCLIPRGIDVQAHLRVPGQESKETAETGLAAAYFGGYAGVLTMPNTRPVIDSVDIFKSSQRLIDIPSVKFDVAVYFSSAISVGQKGEALAPLFELAEAGIKAFTDDGRGVMSDALMKEAFVICAKTGVPLLQHAEMEGHGGVIAPGPIQQALGLCPYPDSAEVEMVARDIDVLKSVRGARYHILHVSAGRTLELVQRAKSDGLHVTAEVSPHHLYFNCTDIDPNNSSFKMNPPLRSKDDQRSLLKGLTNGIIDFVATDHAPHETEVKTKDFVSSANGTLGLETTLPVLVNFFQHKLLSLERLVQVWSSAPAQFLDISPVDSLAPGLPLRGVFLNLQAPPELWTSSDLHSLSKNSCFTGCKLPKPLVGIANRHGIHTLRALHKIT